MKKIIPAISEKSLQHVSQAKQAFQSDDYKTMLEHLKLALSDHNPEAEYWTACAYRYGLGVDQNDAIAAFWLQKAADHGVADAQFEMSQSFYDGIGVKSDLNQAYHYLHQAATNNHPKAQYKLAMLYYRESAYPDAHTNWQEIEKLSYFWTNRSVENNYDPARVLLALHYFYGIGTDEDAEKSLTMLESLAQNWNLEALNFLAYFYINGYQVNVDVPKAHAFLKKAAALKNGAAAHQLGRDLKSGIEGIPIDYPAAQKWLEYAATLGYTDSLVSLGILYYDDSPKKDLRKAFNYFKQASDTGNLFGAEWVGYCYCYGYGVEVDLHESIRYYEMALKKNDPREALYRLGMIWGYYLDPPDYEKAAHRFLEAAQLGHPDAQLKVGFYYHHGRGCEQNYHKAFYWFQWAATQGNLTAINNLGDAYYHGFGVEQDHQIAYSYFQTAANGGEMNAMFDLGKMLYEEKITAPEQPFGLLWIKRAAKKGNREAVQWLNEHLPSDTEP
jgi:TPR repeat protein